MRRLQNQVQVNVTQSLSRNPIQAFVKLYVFNGTSVTGTYLGETAFSGYLNFDMTISPSSVAIAFASSGSSVGYTIMDGQGKALSPSQNGGYVRQEHLQNNIASSRFIFAMEDWTTPQGNLIQVNAFSLPVVILWKIGSAFSFIEYPHLPSNYGAPLPSTHWREYRIMTTVRMGNNTFIWDMYTWRG